jgi:phosphatidylglycerophosphate synthase
MRMDSQEPSNDKMFVYCALALQWFSLFDIMDGVRARRLKSGSPLGRIIDEALDMTQ